MSVLCYATHKYPYLLNKSVSVLPLNMKFYWSGKILEYHGLHYQDHVSINFNGLYSVCLFVLFMAPMWKN